MLVNGAPAFVAGEAAKSNRTNVAALDDDRLFVGGVIDCGAILDTTTGAQTPYSAMDGCGFSAVEGESYHGSRVRVVRCVGGVWLSTARSLHRAFQAIIDAIIDIWRSIFQQSYHAQDE